jgi:hypothetical protein
MGATANIQVPLPAERFDAYAPLRALGTKSRRTGNGLAAYRSPVEGLATRLQGVGIVNRCQRVREMCILVHYRRAVALSGSAAAPVSP